jgi:hypothetical protein
LKKVVIYKRLGFRKKKEGKKKELSENGGLLVR